MNCGFPLTAPIIERETKDEARSFVAPFQERVMELDNHADAPLNNVISRCALQAFVHRGLAFIPRCQSNTRGPCALALC